MEIKSGKFSGFPYVNREKESVMEIGDNCRFRSKTVDNFVGINHV